MCYRLIITKIIYFKCIFEVHHKLNKELSDQGYVTVSGKIPRAFWEKKFYGYSQIAM